MTTTHTDSLTTIFSIVKDPKSGKCGVQIVEADEHGYVRDFNLNIGPLHFNKHDSSGGSSISTSMLISEEELSEKVARLKETPALDARPYEKALEALRAFNSAATKGEGGEILRQVKTFQHIGVVRQKAILKTVETDAATGAETTETRTMTRQDVERLYYEMQYGKNQGISFENYFYRRALHEIGGKVRFKY